MEERTSGWRQLLSAVNLADFADMVGGELLAIGSSVRLSSESFPRLPLGPLAFVAGLLMALARVAALLAVVIVFGAGIAAITIVRGLNRFFRRGRA